MYWIWFFHLSSSQKLACLAVREIQIMYVYFGTRQSVNIIIHYFVQFLSQLIISQNLRIYIFVESYSQSAASTLACRKDKLRMENRFFRRYIPAVCV